MVKANQKIILLVPCFIYMAISMSFAENPPSPPDKVPFPTKAEKIEEAEIDSDFIGTGKNPLLIELHLSPDGVYGLDSTGTEWDYDFSRDSFIVESEKSKSTKTVFGRKKKEQPDSRFPDVDMPEILDSERTITIYSGLHVGSIYVRYDEKVKGSIVATGTVEIDGIVTGDVTSYSKITVNSTGKILGDARAPQIIKMREGKIYGTRSETDIPDLPGLSIFDKSTNTTLIVNLVILGTLFFCIVIIILVGPRPIDRIKTCQQTCFLKSFFTGLLVWILLSPVIALLALTIIGIPVALILIPLAILGGSIMGVVGFCQLIGEKIARLNVHNKSSQMLAALAGLFIYSGPWLIAGLFDLSNSDFLQGLATFLNVISIIIWSIGATAGVGAVFMTRFGNRDCKKIQLQKVHQDWMSQRPTPPPPTPPPLNPGN